MIPDSNGPKSHASVIRIVEVGPRDGLQNESDVVPTAVKVAFVDALSKSGVAEIEAGSFVSPRAIPQLADSDEVFRRIERLPGVIYSALVPNERGLERARAAAVDKDCRLYGGLRFVHQTEHQLHDRRVDRAVQAGGVRRET